jgi:hypothetical protein
MTRAAGLAGVASEGWMQDWPIEVSNAERLTEFLELLEAHRNEWELTYWFLDLVLESARDRPQDLDRLSTTLRDAIVAAVATTRAPPLMQRLEYWACVDDDLDDAFEVSPIVREALLKLK